MADGWSYFIEHAGQRHALETRQMAVGRSRKCDISVPDPSVSRKHVYLTAGGGQIVLQDLGSSNGTFLNGERIEGSCVVTAGQTLELGDAVLKVSIVADAATPGATDPAMAASGAAAQPPQPMGEATSFLQAASVRLAQEAMQDEPPAAPAAEPAAPWATAPQAAAPSPPPTVPSAQQTTRLDPSQLQMPPSPAAGEVGMATTRLDPSQLDLQPPAEPAAPAAAGDIGMATTRLDPSQLDLQPPAEPAAPAAAGEVGMATTRLDPSQLDFRPPVAGAPAAEPAAPVVASPEIGMATTRLDPSQLDLQPPGEPAAPAAAGDVGMATTRLDPSQLDLRPPEPSRPAPGDLATMRFDPSQLEMPAPESAPEAPAAMPPAPGAAAGPALDLPGEVEAGEVAPAFQPAPGFATTPADAMTDAPAPEPAAPVPAAPVPAAPVPAAPVPAAPEVSIPEVALPELAVPEIPVPEVAVPEVALPELAVPEIPVPEVAMPEVSVPEAAMPEVPKLEVALPDAMPSFDPPQVVEPTMEAQAVSAEAGGASGDALSFDEAPSIDPPAADAPSFDPPSFDPPAADTPSFDPPAADTPSFEAPPSFDALPSFDAAPTAGAADAGGLAPSAEVSGRHSFAGLMDESLGGYKPGGAETPAPPAAPPEAPAAFDALPTFEAPAAFDAPAATQAPSFAEAAVEAPPTPSLEPPEVPALPIGAPSLDDGPPPVAPQAPSFSSPTPAAAPPPSTPLPSQPPGVNSPPLEFPDLSATGAGMTDIRNLGLPSSSEDVKDSELLPSLDGFDTTLGPGVEVPEAFERAHENMVARQAEVTEEVPLPTAQYNPYQKASGAEPPRAGFWIRALATILDSIWMAGLSAAATFFFSQQIGLAVSGFNLLVVLVGWSVWGQTPGKKLVGIYVCDKDGKAGIGFLMALVRLAGYMVSSLILGIGFLMALGENKRALHDRIAGTYVRRRR